MLPPAVETAWTWPRHRKCNTTCQKTCTCSPSEDVQPRCSTYARVQAWLCTNAPSLHEVGTAHVQQRSRRPGDNASSPTTGRLASRRLASECRPGNGYRSGILQWIDTTGTGRYRSMHVRRCLHVSESVLLSRPQCLCRRVQTALAPRLSRADQERPGHLVQTARLATSDAQITRRMHLQPCTACPA